MTRFGSHPQARLKPKRDKAKLPKDVRRESAKPSAGTRSSVSGPSLGTVSDDSD